MKIIGYGDMENLCPGLQMREKSWSLFSVDAKESFKLSKYQ